MKHYLILVSVLGLGILSACKKDVQNQPASPSSDSTTTVSANDKVNDTALLIAKDLYLWYKQIPDSFNARAYADPDAIMTAIRKYSIEPGFSQPVDRWSFGMTKTDWNNLSSGISSDFGLGVFFKTDGDLRVKSIEKESPAGLAGIHRGWRILKINGDDNMTTSNVDAIVKNVFQSTSSSFTFQKPDNTTVTITLNAGTYQEHPIFVDSVYTVGSEKVGYLAFNSFLGDTTAIYNQFQQIFNRYAQENVGDVIVDLRYNGGGYVSMQQKLADYLAPLSANGNLMMQEKYNDKYADQNSSENFHKLGTLNLNRIFFIVSQSTASASELLINNLKPYLDVKLIGPNNTYGKPVGFFPVPVGNWYVFPVSLRTTNKNGEGNYFNGLAVDSKVADGLDKDWGDVNESCLASALKYIATGSFRVRSTEVHNERQEIITGNRKLDEPSFKGAVSLRNVIR